MRSSPGREGKFHKANQLGRRITLFTKVASATSPVGVGAATGGRWAEVLASRLALGVGLGPEEQALLPAQEVG